MKDSNPSDACGRIPPSDCPINMGYWRCEDYAGNPGPHLPQGQGHRQCIGNSFARVRDASSRRKALPRRSTAGQALAGMCGRTGPSPRGDVADTDRKSTRLNSSHANISYAVFCLKKKKIQIARLLYAIALACSAMRVLVTRGA